MEKTDAVASTSEDNPAPCSPNMKPPLDPPTIEIHDNTDGELMLFLHLD